MSRKGKIPVPMPSGVEAKVVNGSISVKGPKGTLEQQLMPGIDAIVEDGQILVKLDEKAEEIYHFHGLYRALIENMVIGTSKGFEKRLEMIGTGYRAAVQGRLLDLQVGFSHPKKMDIPEGLNVTVEKNTMIIIAGVDKQLVGQFAALVRSVRPPEPYKGKGIRYEGEHVRKKAGKTAAKK